MNDEAPINKRPGEGSLLSRGETNRVVQIVTDLPKGSEAHSLRALERIRARELLAEPDKEGGRDVGEWAYDQWADDINVVTAFYMLADNAQANSTQWGIQRTLAFVARSGYQAQSEHESKRRMLLARVEAARGSRQSRQRIVCLLGSEVTKALREPARGALAEDGRVT